MEKEMGIVVVMIKSITTLAFIFISTTIVIVVFMVESFMFISTCLWWGGQLKSLQGNRCNHYRMQQLPHGVNNAMLMMVRMVMMINIMMTMVVKTKIAMI